MGYFGNGFVFDSEPQWQALGSLPPAIGLVGYRHRGASAWFLDAWTCTQREHWPFTDELGESLRLPVALPAATEALLGTYQATMNSLPRIETRYAAGWLRLTAAISLVAGQRTFFFAADDEEADMACLAVAGELQRFQVRFGGCSVELVEGRIQITPLAFLEDPELAYSPSELKQLAAVPGAVLLDPVEVSGGRELYGSAVRLWPSEAGDPADTLGIGTWDPFQNVGRDLEVVFQRPCAAPAQKPWWQFWG